MMQARHFATGFDVDTFVTHEAPVTFGLFQPEEATRADLNALFAYPMANRAAMPFYVTDAATAASVAETSERVYAAMCDALSWLSRNWWAVPTYFGKDFCERYPAFIDYALWTYENDHEALYGRFDMAMDPATGTITGVYEFNGDTPVMLFESTVLQNWMVAQVNAKNGTDFDQSNTFYPATMAALDKVLHRHRDGSSHVGVLLHAEYIEDMATCETLFQLLDKHPRCAVRIDHIDNIDFDLLSGSETPWQLSGVPLDNMFVLQPWEEIVESCYDDVIVNWRQWGHKTRFFEPAWRWFLANKGMMALVTELLATDEDFAAEHGDLPFLRTYLSPQPFLDAGEAYVEKPLMGRLSNNIRIHDAEGGLSFASDGMYADEPCVYQAYCAPGRVEGRNNFIVGQWMAAYASPEPLVMQAASLCIREFDKPVLDIKNERFIPHLIVGDARPPQRPGEPSGDSFVA